MVERHKTITTRFIYHNVTGFLKKNPEFKDSDMTLEDFSKQISAKYVLEHKPSIPDKDRVFIVHCKEDDLVLFDEANAIKEQLNLPDDNVLFLDMPKWKYWMAAHNLTGQATLISTFCNQVVKSL
ncbi:MAG: hypothetical protein EU544_03675 [Promethearchaeota archaeon]|nr:MAG: hypothetical protein EU544_03675 [Candidatus Lokiarchaeota archaeon]